MIEPDLSVRDYKQILGRSNVTRKSSRILNKYTRGGEDRRIIDRVLKCAKGLPVSTAVQNEIASRTIPLVRRFAKENGFTWNRSVALLIYRESRERGLSLTPQGASEAFARAGIRVRPSEFWRDSYWIRYPGPLPGDRVIISGSVSRQIGLKMFSPEMFPILKDVYEHVGLEVWKTLRKVYREKYDQKCHVRAGRRPSNLAREALLEADREIFGGLTREQKKQARAYAFETYGASLGIGDKRVLGRKGLLVPSELKRG